jgi:hypothetical protein
VAGGEVSEVAWLQFYLSRSRAFRYHQGGAREILKYREPGTHGRWSSRFSVCLTASRFSSLSSRTAPSPGGEVPGRTLKRELPQNHFFRTASLFP